MNRLSPIHTVVSESDLAPTVCELLGLPAPSQFQGIPLETDGRSFRVGEHRAVVTETLRRANKRGLRLGRWELIHDLRPDEFELYDLEADPREEHDLYDARPELAARFRDRLRRHYSSVERKVADENQLSDKLRRHLEALGYLR